MGAVVVQDNVNENLPGWHLGLEGIEEADELLMPMALHAAADDPAFEHIESGEQRGRCRGACNRGSLCQPGPVFMASQVGCGRGSGFGSHGDLWVKMFGSNSMVNLQSYGIQG